MKHLCFILLGIMFGCQSIIAQSNRYNVAKPAKDNYFNTFVPLPVDQLYQLYQTANSIHERNAKVIDAMINNLYEMKGQTNNTAFKTKLDEFLTKLKNLRMGSLLDAEMKIKQIDWAIRDEIEKFNSGNYSISKNTSGVKEKLYSSGSYLKTMAGAPIRERADVSSKEIANTDNFKVVKIIQKVGDNYYAVELNNLQGYISKAFLLEITTKEFYDEFYSIK